MIGLALAMAMVCAVLLAWQILFWIGPALRRYRAIYTQNTSMQLSEVFLFIDPMRLLTWAMLLACICGGLVFALTASVIAAGVIAMLSARLPRYLVSRFRHRRLAMFERQLPAALLALACALKSGASMSTAWRHVTDHSEAPLAQEFGLVSREQRMGVALEQALERLRDRVPSEACSLIVAALRVASQSGGNVAETLESIARTLRERIQLQGKLQTLTAQGRLQAWIVGALPVLLLAALSYLEPDMMAVLWHTPVGWGVLMLLCVLEIAGMALIRRIVNIDF